MREKRLVGLRRPLTLREEKVKEAIRKVGGKGKGEGMEGEGKGEGMEGEGKGEGMEGEGKGITECREDDHRPTSSTPCNRENHVAVFSSLSSRRACKPSRVVPCHRQQLQEKPFSSS